MCFLLLDCTLRAVKERCDARTSHHIRKETTMKKLLIVLVAIAVLLVGCGSIVGTTITPTPPPTSNVQGNTSPETTCQVLQSQLRMLTQEVQQDTTDLAAAQGDTLATGRIKVSLQKLHLRIQQVQKEYKGCPANL